jgi:hypothetical protein
VEIFFLVAAVEVDLLLAHLQPHQLVVLRPGPLQLLLEFLLVFAAKGHWRSGMVWAGYSRYVGLTFIILMERFREYRLRVVLEREIDPAVGWSYGRGETRRGEEEWRENFDRFADNSQEYFFGNDGQSL